MFRYCHNNTVEFIRWGPDEKNTSRGAWRRKSLEELSKMRDLRKEQEASR